MYLLDHSKLSNSLLINKQCSFVFWQNKNKFAKQLNIGN